MLYAAETVRGAIWETLGRNRFARRPERRKDPLKVAHLHRPHHRGLVDHHHRVLERLAGTRNLLFRGRACC